MNRGGKVTEESQAEAYLQRGRRLSPEGQNVYGDGMSTDECRLYKGMTLSPEDYPACKKQISSTEPRSRTHNLRSEERLNRTHSMKTERESLKVSETKLHRGHSLSPETHLQHSQVVDDTKQRNYGLYIEGSELQVRRNSSRHRSNSKSPTKKTFADRDSHTSDSAYDGLSSYHKSSSKSPTSKSSSQEEAHLLNQPADKHRSSSRSPTAKTFPHGEALRESQKLNQLHDDRSSSYRSRSKSPTSKTYPQGTDISRSRSPSRKHSARLERTKYHEYDYSEDKAYPQNTADDYRKSNNRSNKSSRSRSYEQRQSSEHDSSRSQVRNSERSKSEEAKPYDSYQMTDSKPRKRSSKLQRQDEYFCDGQDTLQVSPDLGKQRKHSSSEPPSPLRRDQGCHEDSRFHRTGSHTDVHDTPQHVSLQADKPRSRKGSTESSRSLDEQYLHVQEQRVYRKNSAEILSLRHELTVDNVSKSHRKHSADLSRSQRDANTLCVQENRLYRVNSAEMPRSYTKSTDRSAEDNKMHNSQQRQALQVEDTPIHRTPSTRSMSRSYTEDARPSQPNTLQVEVSPHRRRSFQGDRPNSRSPSLNNDNCHEQTKMDYYSHGRGDKYECQHLMVTQEPRRRNSMRDEDMKPQEQRSTDNKQTNRQDTLQVSDLKPRRNSFREERPRSPSIRGDEMSRAYQAQPTGPNLKVLPPNSRSRSPSLREDNLNVTDTVRVDDRQHGSEARTKVTQLRVNSIGEAPTLLRAASIQVEDLRVQESDGNFFESFTALAWKQENWRRRAANEDEKEAEKPPPLETLLGRPRTQPLHRKELELLYIEVLYTIKHKIGTTSGGHLPFIQDLYHYAREAFGISPDDHARLMARASEEKPPILILNITVVEARGLEAKDADGFSDPYCMLGIVPGSQLRERDPHTPEGSLSSDDEQGRPRRTDSHKSALKRFSQSFKRRREKTARDTIPARYIKTTTVKPNTLSPVWNEKFRVDLDDIHSDRLHLDIWDHDDEFSVVDAAKRLNEVQNLKGLGRYFKQIAQSARSTSKGNVDDFLGCIDLPLAEIPSTGIDRWFDLDGRSSRSNVEGQIRLRMNLSTREDRGIPEDDNWTDIKQHEDLICCFIDYEIHKFRDDVYRWNGDLPQAALTILHQHAIQGDITEVQEAMCRWTAFSKKHRDYPFSWELLLRLVQHLDSVWQPATLSRDEEEFLADSFTNFIDHCLNLIRRQREIYPAANKAAQYRLEYMLRCLGCLYSTAVFKRCCPFQKDLYAEVAGTLRKASIDFYERLRTNTQTPSQADDDLIGCLIELINLLNTDMQKAVQYYDPIYESILTISYFAIVYRNIERLLGDDLQKTFEMLHMSVADVTEQEAGSLTAQQIGTHLFELYLALQEFCRFREHLSSSDRRNLTVTQFYEWFKSPVTRWIKIAKFKAMSRIRKSVEFDKVGTIEGDVKQSTSAVDVCCCFGQLIEFWQLLEWPDPAGALPIVTRITEDLCEGATYYADLIHQKLKSAGYYDEVGQFDITQQLCITVNNIEQVRRALKPIPQALRFPDIVMAIERSQGERAAKEAKITLYSIVRCADEDMIRKIKQVVDRVADKMRPDIKKYVFHLCWAPESVPATQGITELMNYLDNNLLTLNTNLLRTNFDRILDSIWTEVLQEIRDVVIKEEAKTIAFYERLYEGLEILVDFFHANDKGLPMTAIRSKLYEELYVQLSLNKASTKELIETYYIDKLDEQMTVESTEFGTLSVRVYYNVDAEILSVEVLNARNVIPLDPNGLSDPFVMIELCPHHVFPRQGILQTKIIKNTLNPVFDESFDFSVGVSQCQKEGACILFTVMDHDFLMANDFAGEGYLSLNNIPGISGEHISGFSALKPVVLNLTQPRRGRVGIDKAKGALAALQFRDWDKEALDFVKKRRQVEAQSQQ